MLQKSITKSITEVSSKHCQSITEASQKHQKQIKQACWSSRCFKAAFQPLFKLCTLMFMIPLKCLLGPFFSLWCKYLIFKPKMPLPLYLATVRYIMFAHPLAPGIWVSSIPGVNRHPPLVASLRRTLYNMRMREISGAACWVTSSAISRKKQVGFRCPHWRWERARWGEKSEFIITNQTN